MSEDIRRSGKPQKAPKPWRRIPGQSPRSDYSGLWSAMFGRGKKAVHCVVARHTPDAEWAPGSINVRTIECMGPDGDVLWALEEVEVFIRWLKERIANE